MSLDAELDRIADSIWGPLATGSTAAAESRQSSGNEAVMEAFRQVGLSERAAREAIRGLASGDYFGFDDALIVLNGFDNASVVDWTRAREVARRFGRTILAERRTAVQSRPRVIESGRGTVSGDGTLSIVIIDAGQGSSGFYPASTLEAAARAKVFPAGLQMFLDHPSQSETYERPERSVRDLAGVLATDATYDSSLQALVASATVFRKYRETIVDMAPHIGLSIRAEATVGAGSGGGVVVEEIVRAVSVDFVTQAGRGGRILSAN